VTVTASPSLRLSARRTAALTGKKKLLGSLLMGKIEVFHVELPMVTSTAIEPNPRGGDGTSLTFAPTSGGTCRKYTLGLDSHGVSSEVNSNEGFMP